MSAETHPTSPMQAQGQQMQEAFVERMLDPIDRLVESIYSVLIVMTFTLGAKTFTVSLPAELQDEFVRGLFWSAFGCALAWGMIDGVVYVLVSIFERGDLQRRVRSAQQAPSEAEGLAVTASELEETLSFMDDETRAAVVRTTYAGLREATPPPVRFQWGDFGGAVATFLVAVLAALPVTLPLLLARWNPLLGVRLSNLVAGIMLFVLGYRWARHAGTNPWITGLILLIVGLVIVVIAIPLGG